MNKIAKAAKTPAVSRRTVLKVAAAGAPMIVASRVLGLQGATAPSNRITLGFIGMGWQGHDYNLQCFLQQEDAQTIAVCDCYADRCARAQQTVNKHYQNTGCRTYADFRDLLAAGDIDAVCISTPDHWHVPMSLMALEAGKDILCEKPTLTIAEGRTLADAVAKHKKVFQVGIEDRSLIHYHRLAEIVRNGGIGTLQTIRVKLPAGTAYPKEDPAPVPEGLNYNLWLGPAPFHPYTPNRLEAMHWRQVRDYSGGLLTDWGAHLIDTAQVANFAEETGPVEVEGQGTWAKDSMATMPVQFKLRYRYANGVEMFVESGSVALRFEGSDGWVGNNGWQGRLEASDKQILLRKYDPQTSKLWQRPPSEHRNFLDCVKSRKPTTYTAEAGQRLSTTMHVGNIAMELGRKLRWDPKTEAFLDDDAANRLRSREPRNDWKT